jgi:hypothetical protein
VLDLGSGHPGESGMIGEYLGQVARNLHCSRVVGDGGRVASDGCHE